MAHITLNANTTLTSAVLTLPDNARIVVINADTEEEAADLTISGAESLIITGDDAQITTVTDDNNSTDSTDDDAFAQAVIDEMLNMLDVSPRNADDDSANSDADGNNNENAATSATPTAIHKMIGADDSYAIHIKYNSAADTYTDLITNTEISEDIVINIINRAVETHAHVSMRFNIPNRGVTEFTGELLTDYNGVDGITLFGLTLVGQTGGAYVLNAEQELTDDMSVLEEATFTFVGDADVLFADLDIDIIKIDEYEGRLANTDAGDEDDTDTAAPQRNRVRTFDPDEQLYVSIYADSHNLRSTDICRIISFAAASGLSARMNGVNEPYVGRLEVRDTDTDSGTYTFVDKKFGPVPINLNDADGDPGFSVLEIYSDTEMRRRGFVGTNHTDYTEISVVEMAKHINTALDPRKNTHHRAKL